MNNPAPFNENESCMLSADLMSCAAQRRLAIEEFMKNKYATNYQTNHPVCNRFNELMDRNIESGLIMTEGTSLKKNCLDRKYLVFSNGVWTLDQSGPWVGQHVPMIPPVQERFDVWTRAKGASTSVGLKDKPPMMN